MRWIRILLVILLALLLVWVAGRLIFAVPSTEGRAVESAIPFDPTTTLGPQAVEAMSAHAGKSGVVPLPDGQGALMSRMKLAEGAERSIDAMYYIWHDDTSGMLLLDALRDYPKLSNSERITFEYVMLDGVNDSDEDARRLVKLIRGIPAKINLIPFNEWPGAPYKRSSWERIEKFADIIYTAGYASPIRTPRGEDIMAACGQLKSATERARKSRAQIAAETA